jgi:hypothetical protein
MVPIKVTIHRVENGHCSLTGKDGDGLSLSFDDGTVKESFLSWRGFRQLLSMKAGQDGRLVAKPPSVVPEGK